ncbi:MAG: Hsp20/alpha crystallin family protein [Solobacterium sp.]|nr:Hsp20/alpha crystallin family protein [Solobacterium sp.]
MRFMPMMRNEDFDLFDDVFSRPFFKQEPLMKTDVEEKDGNYILKMDLPGYDKEDIKISLYNGNLSIQAQSHREKEEKDEKGKVIRKERFSGNCSRSFYVGEGVRETDVHAGFDNGVLTITVPAEAPKQIEEKKFIQIQ